MEQSNFCENCKVKISSDLSNCPLCGKHILKADEHIQENRRSYPLYDFAVVNSAKWYNIIRCLFWVIALICTITNLVFKTEPYWFPYVLTALTMIFHGFIAPIKRDVSSYIKSITLTCFIVGMFLIFLDAYNYFTLQTNFGWALSFVAPIVMTCGVVSASIICLSTHIYENQLLRNITFLAIFSIIYFIVKMFAFSWLATWPSLVFMCVSIGFVVILELVKRNRLIKELIKDFHM